MYKIGYSEDIHRLVENRKLILGGINIPFEKGLLGHSDADVLFHAISESILGALALGDLGTYFPDNDKKTENMNSADIVKYVVQLMENKGYYIENIDSSIICEKPKLASYIPLIRKNISIMLHCDVSCISVKAGTNEGIDEIGKGAAIKAAVIVLLKKDERK